MFQVKVSKMNLVLVKMTFVIQKPREPLVNKQQDDMT